MECVGRRDLLLPCTGGDSTGWGQGGEHWDHRNLGYRRCLGVSSPIQFEMGLLPI